MAAKLKNAPRQIAPAEQPPPPPIGDNSGPVAGIEEAQMLSAIAKIRLQQITTKKAKAAFDAEKDKEKELFRLAKAAGFSRDELEEILEDSKKDGYELDDQEERRTRLRGYAGLPAGHAKNQTKELALDKEPRDAAWWEGEGYRTAIRGGEAKAPDDCPPEFHQPFLEGWHNGSKRTAWAQETVSLAAPPMDAGPAPQPALAAQAPAEEAEPI